MKKDQKQQMRSQDKESLIKRLSEIAKQLVDLKMDFVMGKLKNVHSMKQLKKERAYINTILAEK